MKSIQQRPDSPEHEPSYLSTKSDESMGGLIDFKGGTSSLEQRINQEWSEVPEVQPSPQHQTDNLKKKLNSFFEEIDKARKPTHLNDTERYITKARAAKANDEHEARRIGTALRNPAKTEKFFQGIFRSLTGRDKPIRTVMTKRVSGIGNFV